MRKLIALCTYIDRASSDMQCNCMMGVFPPISRAWLTIDSDIFMWNYEDGYVWEAALGFC